MTQEDLQISIMLLLKCLLTKSREVTKNYIET
jgi:hypothetical protein